jgi:hypothetical protein
MSDKVISFKVPDQDWLAFEEFAKRHGIVPYKALRGMVTAWAGAERLRMLMASGGSQLDALAEFARLTQEIKGVFRLNGELAAAIKWLAERYGLQFDIEALWQQYGQSLNKTEGGSQGGDSQHQ